MNAPEHLDPVAIAKWQELAPTLDVTQPGTADALTAYCSAWSRWTAAEAQVSTLGAVVKSPAGFAVANPYIAIAAAAQRQMRQWGDVLGLHKRPAGRKANQGDDPEKGGNNSLLRLLGGTAPKPTKTRGRKATA